MRACKCGHSINSHALMQQTSFPFDEGEPLTYRGHCGSCSCILFADKRQMTIAETYGEITIQ